MIVDRSYLKLLFFDILNGYTVFNHDKYGQIYIKHFTTHDNLDSERIFNHNIQVASKRNIPTIVEKLEALKQDGLWSDEQEKQLKNLEFMLNGLKKSKSKLPLQKDRDVIAADITKTQADIDNILQQKYALLGYTAETFANRKLNEYFIKNSLFQSPQLTQHLYNQEDFNELDELQLNDLIKMYNQAMVQFDIQAMQKIAVSPFFINLFYLTDDNPYIFYGKPIVQLTFYQIHLFELGKFFKTILQEATSKLPEDTLNDPDKLIEWYEASKNAEKLMKPSKKEKTFEASSIVGATKKDYEALGLAKGSDVLDLNKVAAEKGGQLSMEDLIKLHGA